MEWLGWAVIALGAVTAVAAILVAARMAVWRTTRSREQVAASVQAAKSDVLDPPAPQQDPAQAFWELDQHAAEVTRQRLALSVRHYNEALDESRMSFWLGSATGVLGFLAILGSLGWILATGADIAWLGVISGVVCETVAALFIRQTTVTRQRSSAMSERVEAEANRRARAREAMIVAQSISRQTIREQLIADAVRSLLDLRYAAPPTVDPLKPDSKS